jgi:16S rRNA (uracil1498-N3)-methyltransferase
MGHRSFYPRSFCQGEMIDLAKEEMHHLKQVMRLKEGSPIEIVNGKGDLGEAIFGHLIKIEKVIHQKQPVVTKNLALALTEPKHLELVIEKGTELGIDSFFIFPSKKSKLQSLSLSKQERIEKILISALKQSKRLYLPKVNYLSTKEELPEGSYLLGDFSGKPFERIETSATFIIGPESGFTSDECLFFEKKLSATPILLSKNVLRTETAALCAATLLSL